MAFQAEQKPINDLLTNNVLDIPRNQRNYVWKKDNWQDLLSDLNFIVKNSDQKNHFIGSIVLQEKDPINGLKYFTIIDGQQRTITIILFLAALLKIFQDEGMEDDFNGTIQYLISKDRKSKNYCVLYSDEYIFIDDFINKIANYQNKRSIEDIVHSCIIDKNREKNLTDCVLFFYENIRQEMGVVENPHTYIVALKDAILDTKYVRITADTEEDSYTIFEILNARGLSLAEHELLKNYIMRYILPQNTKDVVKKKWEQMEISLGSAINRFFKHYTTHIIRISNKDQIYKTLQKAFPKDNVVALLDDLMLKQYYYHIILYPEKEGENKNCSDIEHKTFRFFKLKRAEQFRPIILSLMSQKNKDNLSESKYNEVLRFIYSFFVCYNIIGEEKSNKLEDTIYKYAPLIENDFSEQIVNDFIDSLKKKTPSIKTFTERLQTLGWSNHYEFYKDSKNKERVKIVLELIEGFLSGKDFVDDFSIEHVLPDSQEQSNALIGNLLPLEQRLNELCKDKDLIEKIKYFSQSNFKMTRNFAERYKNNDFNIDSRSSFLAKLLYNDILNL